MSKLRMGIGMCLALALCATAYARATKVKCFCPAGDGAVLNPNADGMAILNYHPDSSGTGHTEIHVSVTDLAPFTQYQLQVRTTFGFLTQTISTNASGNSSTTLQASGDRSECTEIIVWEEDGVDITTISDSELRIIGDPTGACCQ